MATALAETREIEPVPLHPNTIALAEHMTAWRLFFVETLKAELAAMHAANLAELAAIRAPALGTAMEQANV